MSSGRCAAIHSAIYGMMERMTGSEREGYRVKTLRGGEGSKEKRGRRESGGVFVFWSNTETPDIPVKAFRPRRFTERALRWLYVFSVHLMVTYIKDLVRYERCNNTTGLDNILASWHYRVLLTSFLASLQHLVSHPMSGWDSDIDYFSVAVVTN